MNPQLKITSSINPNDIHKVMSIVATFGANAENIIKIRDYIKNELKELADNRILYLLEDIEPVAMVQLILKNADNRPELANGKEIAHIHALQVSKTHHRQGYGLKLMQLLELEAIARGVKTLTLGVDSDNEKALNLYKKLNYSLMKTLEGRTPEVQLHYLQKRLN
ncbi:GNAT family N-acetyltransferase [Bacteriovorax sp. PP10]|uniref:GNAT family N-acetyltransferase n=1 Tax=Bacteriovorax antarcticus TaxID=3088717 RepID=A0ABU5VXF6_9BACT|nr:GNAT family N-acetyltransferase [Bacteriovorax sp. PP10]MEA9356999.1 GNAT family N-acetyltransferase [Bacteriovorax sp. PP10]